MDETVEQDLPFIKAMLIEIDSSLRVATNTEPAKPTAASVCRDAVPSAAVARAKRPSSDVGPRREIKKLPPPNPNSQPKSRGLGLAVRSWELEVRQHHPAFGPNPIWGY